MPVSAEVINSLSIETKYGSYEKAKLIPNCQAIWDALGVKMTKNGLVKKSL